MILIVTSFLRTLSPLSITDSCVTIQALCPTQATIPLQLRNTGLPLLQPPVALKVAKLGFKVGEVKVMEEQGRRDWAADKVTLTRGSATSDGPLLKLQPDLGGAGDSFWQIKGT